MAPYLKITCGHSELQSLAVQNGLLIHYIGIGDKVISGIGIGDKVISWQLMKSPLTSR